MASNIREVLNNGTSIRLVYESGSTTDIAKANISDINYTIYNYNVANFPTIDMQDIGITSINYGCTSDDISPQKNVNIDWRTITTPVTASASDLFDVISGYGSDESSSNRQAFTSTAGQTEFTVTEFTLNDNVSVFVNGSLVNESLYSRSDNTITFTSGQADGVEVVILN